MPRISVHSRLGKPEYDLPCRDLVDILIGYECSGPELPDLAVMACVIDHRDPPSCAADIARELRDLATHIERTAA